MEAEETFIEHAPVTPAHKFAWRALKGFVYGSPESPENMGKENTYPTRLSPQKRVSIDVPSLSPQKRKRDSQLSPTKSILRTPGAPTPRAKSLRDVNVKFKSISPEVQRTLSAPVTAIAALEQQVDNLWQEVEHSFEIAKKPQAKKPNAQDRKSTRSTKKPADQPVVSVVAVSPDEEREAYARRTEKEVKQLLRQYKRLRDYAQRADEQNVELQSMVDELRNENARLKARLERQDRELAAAKKSIAVSERGSDQLPSGDGKDRAAQRTVTDTAMAHKQTTSLSRTEAFKRSLRGEDPDIDLRKSTEDGLPTRTRMAAPARATSPSNPAKPAPISAAKDPKPRAERQPSVPTLSGDSSNRTSSQPTKPASTTSRTQPLPQSQSQSHAPRPLRAPQPIPPTTIPHAQIPHAQDRKKHSPLSLTALAAQLEPTPAIIRSLPSQGISRITSTSTSTSSATNSLQRMPSLQPVDHVANDTNRALSLTADRVAAARLRLAKKKEGRGVGNATSLAFVGGGGGGLESSRLGGADREAAGGGEESAVDWAGL